MTVPDVRLPAFGLEEENLPLPRILYLHFALLSFFLAFFTVRFRSFGTLHFFLVEVAGGAGGGGGRRDERRSRRDAADLVADVLGEPERPVRPGSRSRPAGCPGSAPRTRW